MPAHRTRDTQSRSLEVTTDAPSPPMLTIISPTPRAFTFPTSHNLSDSPYSTPSNSPFEPDLRSLALSSASSSCTTPPPLLRTLTPDSVTSVSSSSHIRRKSSLTSSDVERRPKKGDEGYIKRPENAFILFRRKCCEERQQESEEGASKSTSANKKQRQADLSKAISQQWKALSTEDRQHWETLAKEKKKEHEQLYPNYVYRPQRVRDKDGKARNKKRKGMTLEAAMEKDKSISFVIPPRQHQGRSASAPTPPPMSYQTIQVPNLFSGAPSCPTSPSLLPMISRRAAHSGNPEDVMSNFDYRPSEHFTSQGNFAGGLQPSFYDPISQQQPSRLIMPSAPVLSGLIISPASSGPSSPASGPFTPTSAILPPLHQHASFADLDTEPELQDQEYMLDYASCGWGSSIWNNNESSILTNSDFDLSSIPPMELGFSKDIPPSFESGSYAVVESSYEGYSPDNYMDYSQDMEYSQPQDESLMNFDEIITGRHLQA